jgi:hypothetical protein
LNKEESAMGLFSKKEASPRELSEPATIVLTCNSIPSHNKATYWFEVSINDKVVGCIEQNGIPSVFTTKVDKNVLRLVLIIELKNGEISRYKGSKQTLELKGGDTVKITHENRRFIIDAK